ncbi:unnamed protein product [Ceratitis capitata]|uniref:(Mediterranean fruit fly) hypothetical protein n=1 Tax=Ceratitis capitata TaxID=7213 RepID=A0A811UVH7_CERCA|nr:unnamed protein product [Ceratitis capitata]
MDEKFSASSVTQILRELLSSFPEADDVVSQILADRMFRYGTTETSTPACIKN